MTEILIKKEKTVAFSGHRSLGKDFNKLALCNEIIRLIETGYDTFLVGMAVGFDTECFKILEKIREKNPIKIIACIPCREQDKNFLTYQKREYQRMVKSADEKIVLQEEYDKYCMLKRNDFLVDNASVLIAYLRKNQGGTEYTVRRAKKKGIKIINI